MRTKPSGQPTWRERLITCGSTSSPDEFKLYKLIWQRFVASQMNPAVFDQTTIDISAGDYLLRATGSVEKFNGFRAVYEEGKDEKAEDGRRRRTEAPPAARSSRAKG